MEDHRTEDVEQNGEDVEQGRDVDQVAPALIAVHPNQDSVAVSVGLELRVFDLRKDYSVSLVDESGLASHKDPIRAIRYGAKGNLFVSAGDDKLVKIWNAVSWHCLSTLCSDKRVSAVAISSDELHVCYADKFGVVWVVALSKSGGQKVVGDAKSVPMLAHYCSIITSLEFSPDGRFIVSADRDFKIRVTVFPENPLKGAHEIQSFCLGHTEFVSCLAFICSQELQQNLLVSGSGDSTVRLWDVTSGDLLDTCKVVAKAEDVKSNGSEDECSSVTDICTIPDCSFVAVAIQSLHGIMLLRCDLSSKCLSIVKVVPAPGVNFVPTSLARSVCGGLLWMVMGVSNSGSSGSSGSHLRLSRVMAISGFQEGKGSEPTMLRGSEIPGGAKLLEKLQGSVSIDENVFLAAAEAVKTAMSSLLIKKQYSAERREFRKRNRNDKRTIQ